MGLAHLVPERRAIDASRFNFGDASSWETASGIDVTEDRALSVPAFMACVDRKASAMAAMPVDAFVRDGDVRIPVDGPDWLRQANVEQTWEQFIAGAQWSYDVDGNVFIAPVRDARGRVVEVWLLDHRKVVVERYNGRKLYTFDGREYRAEVVHVTARTRPGELRAPSIITLNRELFGVAVAVAQYAAGYFGQAATPPGIIEAPNGMTPEAAKILADSWGRRHGGKAWKHRPGVLVGATWKQTAIDAERTQLVAVQEHQGVQICSLTGVPPVFVGLSTSGSGLLYQNVFTAFVGFMRQAMLAPMKSFATAFGNLMPPGEQMTFRTEVFEKPDTRGRYEIYEIGKRAGFLTDDDIRRWEDLAPLEGGDADAVVD